MEQQKSFRQTVGILTLISVPFAIANFVLTGIASSAANPGSMDFTDLSFFIKAGVQAGQLMKWAWTADLLGYYLLLIPAAFFIYHWLKKKNPYWMQIFTFSGLAYLFTGCLGAAVLARIFPQLLSGYAGADGTAREIYSIVFAHGTEMVNGGFWGNFEFLLAGIWWIGIGFVMQQERKALGVFTIVTGLFSLTVAAGHIFDIKMAANIGLGSYFLLSPAWACWVGITILRGKNMAGDGDAL